MNVKSERKRRVKAAKQAAAKQQQKKKIAVDVVERPNGKYAVEVGPLTAEQADQLMKELPPGEFRAVDSRLSPSQSAMEKIQGKTYEVVSDGFGGMIVPDEVVDAIQTDRAATPADKSFRQTPDMMVFEGRAGTVTEVTDTSYTAILSQDGKHTITVDSSDAKVGDRVVNVENEDGSGFAIAIGKAEHVAEYRDGDSVVFYVTKGDKDGVGKMDILPTVEKNVTYPRFATINGVAYPYVYAHDDDSKIPYAIVKTSKGWTIGGELVRAQHAENVAVDRANNGGTLPEKVAPEAKTVLFVVKNLDTLIEAVKTAPVGTPVTVDEDFITVTSTNIRKQAGKPNVFAGVVISETHDPKLAYGWYAQKPSEADLPAYDWLFRSLYGEALKKFNYLPVAEEIAA